MLACDEPTRIGDVLRHGHALDDRGETGFERTEEGLDDRFVGGCATQCADHDVVARLALVMHTSQAHRSHRVTIDE